MKNILIHIVLFFNQFSLFYIIVSSGIYFVQLIAAAFNMTAYFKSIKSYEHDKLAYSDKMLPISLLVPAFNEEVTIVDNIKNLMDLSYPEYEIIVINDGSEDGTLARVIEEFQMIEIQEPYKISLQTEKVKKIYRSKMNINLILLDKENGGKADALNAGINISKYPIFAAIDADSLLEGDSLVKLILPFYYDSTVVANGGIVRIASGCKIVDGKLTEVGLSENVWAKLQTVEYLRAFLAGRMGFDATETLLIISGAFGAFRKQAVIDVGGYAWDCIGEDMELVVHLHEYMREKKQKYKVKFIPDPVCWTQPPETLKDLKSQRTRWHIGLMSSLLLHKKMILNPKYGRIGMFAVPYFWLFEMLGPLIETIGYILIPISFLLNVVNFEFMLTFYSMAVLFGVVLSVGSLILEEYTFKRYPSFRQTLKLFLYCIVDNFGYRQINNIFKVIAIFKYRSIKNTWGSIQRKQLGNEKKSI